MCNNQANYRCFTRCECVYRCQIVTAGQQKPEARRARMLINIKFFYHQLSSALLLRPFPRRLYHPESVRRGLISASPDASNGKYGRQANRDGARTGELRPLALLSPDRSMQMHDPGTCFAWFMMMGKPLKRWMAGGGCGRWRVADQRTIYVVLRLRGGSRGQPDTSKWPPGLKHLGSQPEGDLREGHLLVCLDVVTSTVTIWQNGDSKFF